MWGELAVSWLQLPGIVLLAFYSGTLVGAMFLAPILGISAT